MYWGHSTYELKSFSSDASQSGSLEELSCGQQQFNFEQEKAEADRSLHSGPRRLSLGSWAVSHRPVACELGTCESECRLLAEAHASSG